MDLCPEADAMLWLNVRVTDVICRLPSVLYLLVQYLVIFLEVHPFDVSR